MSVPWVEKYRPQSMKDVVGNPQAISRLQVIAQQGNLPNLLLCGPPGTGKTTSMLCLARDLLGCNDSINTDNSNSVTKDYMKDAVLQLNASDDRGLDVVREKIKLFAQTRKTLPRRFLSRICNDNNAKLAQTEKVSSVQPQQVQENSKDANHTVNDNDNVRESRKVIQLHKIVILDEADSMTPAAQQALRRTMELYSNTTRFAFACNNSSKIIEPIQSRCAVVRFSKLSNVDILKRLIYVIRQENVAYTDDGLEAILYLAEGDLRQAMNSLQATSTGYGLVNADNVFKVCDQPHPVLVQNILRACLQHKDLNEAHKQMHRLLNRGYAPADVMATFFKIAQNNVRLFHSELEQLEVLKVMSMTTMRVAEGVGSPLQLASMLAQIINVVSSQSS